MASEAAVSVLVCVVAAILFYGPWQWVCTDWIRQTCFEARDKIFDIAADGRMTFGSPEYQAIRRGIESEIRFAHQLTLPYLLIVGFGIELLRPKMVKAVKARELEMRARISDLDTRHEVEAILALMNKRVLYLMMLKSPVLVVIPVIILVPVVMCFAAAKGYIRVLASAASTVIRLISSLGGGEAVPRGSWSVL